MSSSVIVDAKTAICLAEATIYAIEMKSTGASVHRLNNRKGALRGLMSMVVARPTEENIEYLVRFVQEIKTECLDRPCPCEKDCKKGEP